MSGLASAAISNDVQRITVLDTLRPDSMMREQLVRLTSELGDQVQVHRAARIDTAVLDLAQRVQDRVTAMESDMTGAASGEPELVVVTALHRARMLRHEEPDFSFSMDEQEKKQSAAEAFEKVLREGAAVGIHVMFWCDSLDSLEQTLVRGALRLIGHRVLLQMNATDSSQLIDSPAAARLGMRRAMYFSERVGLCEKFRPYALPSAALIQQLRDRGTSKR